MVLVELFRTEEIIRRTFIVLMFVFFLCVLHQEASAFEYPAPIKIQAIVMSSAKNYHFRVISNNPGAWLCSNGPTNEAWAYINEDDSGAKGKMAALLLAYSMGKTVTLTTAGVDGGGVTYCHIFDFRVSD